YDGTEALREARDWRPDVVLLDIGMPGMDGFEVAAHFRDEERLQGIVLIALTGYGQDEDRQRAREAGFHHYLVKPVPPETLHELLSGIAVALGKSATDSAVRFRGLSPFRGSHRAFLAEIDETAPWSS
ncbi:MAG TPA: response regulator, partial [Gemmataceae bacterium]|nr:response regulator [Gemmataceae bacterium]